MGWHLANAPSLFNFLEIIYTPTDACTCRWLQYCYPAAPVLSHTEVKEHCVQVPDVSSWPARMKFLRNSVILSSLFTATLS